MRLLPLLLPKLVFWLVIIGIAILLVPNPRWPASAGYGVLALAAVVTVVGFIMLWRRKAPPAEDRSKQSDGSGPTEPPDQ